MREPGPLSGLRVVDFTWAAMGPYAGYLLAGLGAEVIQVSRPPKGSSSTTAAITQFFDVGKTCVKINVKEPRGRKILLDLIGQSDIFLENFRPGVVEGLGLDFETLSKTSPELVMVSGSALGRGGEDSSYVGYAPIFSALSGLADVTGFADGRPTEIRYPCDLTSGALMAFAAIAGVANLKGGKGAYVDLAARDALIWTLTSAFAVQANEPTQRQGNSHDTAFPHGVYRCAGEDQWSTIAVQNDKQRQSLYDLIGWSAHSGAETESLSDLDRKNVEAAITAWTSKNSTEIVVAELQALGISAFASVDARDIWEDSHLRSRNFFQHSKGVGWVAASPWCLEDGRENLPITYDAAVARKRVFSGILGIEAPVIEQLQQAGVLG